MVMKNKTGAIELSMSTIVILVLAMSMLILGLVLVRTIFSTGTNIMKMTDQQLRAQVSKIFAEDEKLTIYPDSRQLEIRIGSQDGVGIGIKNLLQGISGASKFSYTVTSANDPTLRKKCVGIDSKIADSWMVTGSAEDNIEISPGDVSARKVLFSVPSGAPLCTIRYTVTVSVKGTTEKFNDYFDITIKPKS